MPLCKNRKNAKKAGQVGEHTLRVLRDLACFSNYLYPIVHLNYIPKYIFYYYIYMQNV